MAACVSSGCLGMIKPWPVHANAKQALVGLSRSSPSGCLARLALRFAAKSPRRGESSSSRGNRGGAGPTRSALREVDDRIEGVARSAVRGDSSAKGDAPAAERSEEVGNMAASAAEPARSREELQRKESFDSQENIQKMPSQLGTGRLVARASDLWQGVVEETRLIEWPSFQNVIGTTGVVLGIIVGSSLVLLTVNAILAELSESVLNNPAIMEGAKSYLNGS